MSDLDDLQEKLMEGQLNQHFIFNALNTIKCAVILDQRQACSLINDFSKYLRFNLNVKDIREPVGFRYEMEQVRSYANIEMARFSKVKIEYKLEEEDFFLPPMSVQPLVENAISHGLCRKRDGGTVSIHSYCVDNYYQIEIIDDGRGFIPEHTESLELKPGSIENIRMRLEKLMEGRLIVKSQELQGTKVLIQIPVSSARTRAYLSGEGGSMEETDENNIGR